MAIMASFKLSSKCKICKLAAKNKIFEQEIWNSKKFRPKSKEAKSLRQIATEYNVTYNSLVVHVRKHQNMKLETYNKKEMDKIARRAVTRTIAEEKALVEKLGGPSPTGVWDDVISQAMEQVKSGEIKLNANHLLKAAKDKSDFDIKKKNQDMAIMEMMWHFASGEATGSLEYDRRVIEGQKADDYDVADVVAGHLAEWKTRPGAVYNSATGDALTSGADKVFEGDDF